MLRPMKLLAKWALYATALLALAHVYPGVVVNSFGQALLAALVIGLFNTLLRPLLVLLTLPVTLLTLGLFIFVINTLLFQLAGALVDGFQVGGFWSALLGSVGYSVTAWALSAILLRKR